MRRLLVVLPDFPLPERSGGAVEAMRRIRALARRDEKPYIVCFSRGGHSAAALDELRSYSEAALIVDRSWGVQHFLRRSPFHVSSRQATRLVLEFAGRLGDRVSAVLADSMHCIGAARAIATHANRRLLLRSHNIESELFHALRKCTHNPLKKAFYFAEAARYRRIEASKNVGGVECIFEISTESVRRWPATCAVTWLPPIGTQRGRIIARDPEGECSLLWVGSLHFEPNLEALRWFVREHWQPIRRAVPNLTLTVVGSRATAKTRQWLASIDGVISKFDVPSVSEYFEQCDLFINPTMAGSGVNMKIVDAATSGCCIVSTKCGVRGLGRDASAAVVVADGEGFRQSVVQLSMDSNMRHRARERVIAWSQLFSEDTHCGTLMNAVAKL